MKSDLKFLECAAHGVAALASPTVYEQTIEDGKNGLTYRDPQDFVEKLSTLIEDGEFRRRLGQHTYQWGGEHRLLCRHYRERYDWYRQMYARLPELNEALERRIPGILSRLPGRQNKEASF